MHRLAGAPRGRPQTASLGLLVNSHDPDFQTVAAYICRLYARAAKFRRQGDLLIGADEKCGMQILQREHSTQPAWPGHTEKREHNSIRHGTRWRICMPHFSSAPMSKSPCRRNFAAQASSRQMYAASRLEIGVVTAGSSRPSDAVCGRPRGAPARRCSGSWPRRRAG